MKCPNCNYESPTDFGKCPACGTPVANAPTGSVGSYPYQANQATYQQPYSYYTGCNQYYANKPKKSTGENVAIGVAVVVSILSVIAMFGMYIGFVIHEADKEMLTSSENYENFYDDFYNEFYNDFYNSRTDDDDDRYGIDSPAPKNTPIEFEEDLYSFSQSYVDTTYNVEMEETYRGDAALKLLNGAKLPELAESEEIFLVKFKITVTKQESAAYVTLYPAYSGAFNKSGNMYTALYSIEYANNTQLLMEGESGTRWLAFIIDKDTNPYIAWDTYEEQYFLNKEDSISNPSNVTAGEAIEQNISDDSSDVISSAE